MGNKKTLSILCATLLLALLCMPLVACGGSAAGTGEQAEQGPTNTFQGRKPRDAADLKEFVDKANKKGEERKAAVDDKQKDGDLTKEHQEELDEAYAAYKEKDYEAAEKAYNKILEDHPTNYGANVNLVLALLQQGRNDEALTQALTCVYLYPSDTGPMLNAQTAGVAVGFDIKDVNTTIEDMAKERGEKLDLSSDSNQNAYDLTYNLLWDRIDTELYDEAAGDEGQMHENYEILREELADLLGKQPDDEDVLALVDYFEAAAKKLGFAPSGLVEKDEEAEDEKAEKEESSSSKKSDSSSSSSSKKDESSSSSSKKDNSSSSSSKKDDSSSSKKSDSSSSSSSKKSDSSSSSSKKDNTSSSSSKK